MKKLLFSLLTVALVLTSCGPSAVKFNDSIVEEQMSMLTPIQEYVNKISQSDFNGSFSDVETMGDSLITKIDKSIEVVNALETPAGGEKFKEVAIDYFKSMKDIVVTGNKITAFGSDSVNEEAVMSFLKEFSEKADVAAQKENTFLSVQKEFAKEKNMQLK